MSPMQIFNILKEALDQSNLMYIKDEIDEYECVLILEKSRIDIV